MPFVVDASVAATWLLPDEGHTAASNAKRRLTHDIGIVPPLWWFEIRNMLVVSERRHRIDIARTNEALDLLRGLPIRFDRECDEANLFALARRHRLTVYDAAYLETAIRHGAALATLDKALATAAHVEGVELIGADPH